MLLFSSRR